MQQKFLKLLKSTERNGIDDLILYIANETDFFTAPASSKNHGNYEHGLLEHSIDVYDNLIKIITLFDIDCKPDSAILVSLLHDLCKTNFYVKDKRNKKRKDDDGNDILNGYGKPIWFEEPYFSIEDQIPLGHGEKSAILALQFIKLNMDEIMAIRWHMGGWDDLSKSYSGGLSLNSAMDKYPLIAALHMADVASVNFKKKVFPIGQ